MKPELESTTAESKYFELEKVTIDCTAKIE